MLYSLKKRRLTALLLVLSTWLYVQPLAAQNKMLTMEDAHLNRALVPANLKQLGWIPNTDDYAYLKADDKKDKLVRGTAGKKKENDILKLDDFSDAMVKAGAEKQAGFPQIQWRDKNNFVVTVKGKLYNFDVKKKAASLVTSIADEAENGELDPTKQKIAYTKANNLYISQKGAPDVAVTQETMLNIVNGQTYHRSEFGITKGTFWSPSGNSLAFARMDQTMVTDYPILEINNMPATVRNIKYPMAGGKSHHATIGVYNLNSKQTVFLKTGEPLEQYLTNVTWSPDEKSIYIAVVNREQNHMKLNQYDAASGNFVKTLFEEKNEKYVEPENGLYFLPKDAGKFLWLSERDGFNHLYLYDTNGQLIRQVTKGNWMVTDVLGFDKGGRVIYRSTAESPLERHVYAANVNSGAIERISQGSGTHNAVLSPNGNFIIDNYSSTMVPRTVRVIGTDAKVANTLLVAPNPLKEFALGETKLFPIKAEDGTDLYCRMITPPNFDKNKKYPAVVYIYGGPHAQLITESWLGGSNLWMQLMAQKGYVVFTVDTRGSAGRGFAFESAVHRQLGTLEMQDVIAGTNHLKSQPFVDANRVGIHGWSYGGFMTTSLMTRTPDAFKVGVAGGPVIDWNLYEVMYTERYMDTPQENPEGYKANTLYQYIPNLKGRLLMIHGTIDDVVVWQHSMTYTKKAVDAGKQIDYFMYPGHPHNVLGKDRVHLMNKVTQYFDDFLLNTAPAVN
ncbi:S9 family peptidase [Adhaeribacter sp. BT258]|uniref:S9 family peptidase n=1 Tax=Adhaeribacter terrigena TaxID=2793070 RepID=A0ABS1BY16_9BACT|nr:DPP IV N-terminal domain-containing protein [Adhaeribacter terrigena]MBK0402058.1 S9 family peptidase [Adhaeribacter terrigena]